MSKISINSYVGKKEDIAKTLQEILGVSFDKTEEIINSMNIGKHYGVEVKTGTEEDIIKQLGNKGIVASSVGVKLNKNSENEKDNNNVKKFDESLKQITVSPEGREETLRVLNEIGKIAESLEILTSEITSVETLIETENKKAEELRNAVTGKIRLIEACVIIVSLFTWSIVPILFTVIIWIVLEKTIVAKDRKEHEVENNANAERYIAEVIQPLMQKLQDYKDEIKELKESGLIEWAKDFVGEDLFYSKIISDLCDLVKGRRADSLKEALNLYEDAKYKARMEERQIAIQRASEISATEAKKQTEYSRVTAKNTAKTAKNTAKIAYDTRQIDKNTRIFR